MKYLLMLCAALLMYSFVLKSAETKAVASQSALHVTSKLNQPDELGKVNWLRNLEEGIEISKQVDKPIFLLFQEVPGCSTCQQYGKGVLSHPLIVEAIEAEFVPVAIFNNKRGVDAEVLKYFNEPSWNNPVVRIIDRNKKDLVKRVAGNYSELAVLVAIRGALQKSQLPIPEYLNVLTQEFEARKNGLEEATVSMYCFWTGEKKLAELPGVVETQPGFMGGKEVVQIKFDPSTTDYQSVLKFAQANDCASHVFTNNKNQSDLAKSVVGKTVSSSSNFRLDADPKYYLSKTDYQYIPMSSLQAVIANAEIGKGSNPAYIFSERQLKYLKEGSKEQSLINVPISEAWNWN